jgi:hypothetical protein
MNKNTGLVSITRLFYKHMLRDQQNSGTTITWGGQSIEINSFTFLLTSLIPSSRLNTNSRGDQYSIKHFKMVTSFPRTACCHEARNTKIQFVLIQRGGVSREGYPSYFWKTPSHLFLILGANIFLRFFKENLSYTYASFRENVWCAFSQFKDSY